MFIELTSFYKFRILSTCKNKQDYLSCALEVYVLVLLTLALALNARNPRHDTIVNTKLKNNHVLQSCQLFIKLESYQLVKTNRIIFRAPQTRCLGSIDIGIGIDCSLDIILSSTRNWKIIMFIESTHIEYTCDLHINVFIMLIIVKKLQCMGWCHKVQPALSWRTTNTFSSTI